MTIEGRPRFMAPPSEEQVAQWRTEADASRREREEAEARSAPVRRRLLEAGPPLRDIDAAMACHDSCHPRVDVTDRHQGGTTCTCQQSPEEREQARRRWLDAMPVVSLWDDAGERAGVDRVAEELDVAVHRIGGLAPFQITGTVDGRSFYLRARHEVFTLTLAPEDRPALFTDDASTWGVGELEIASGDEDELGPRWADALTFSAARIRDYLRQQACQHLTSGGPGSVFRFCPLCGARLAG